MFQTNVGEKIKKNIRSIFFYRELYEMLKSTVQSDSPHMTWHMRLACWIPEATNTHSEYITRNVFPLQQWLPESTSILRYT